MSERRVVSRAAAWRDLDEVDDPGKHLRSERERIRENGYGRGDGHGFRGNGYGDGPLSDVAGDGWGDGYGNGWGWGGGGWRGCPGV